MNFTVLESSGHPKKLIIMEKFVMPKELVMCMNIRHQCSRVPVTKDGTVKPVKQTIPISWENKKISWE